MALPLGPSAALPELLAFESERRTPVLAITDEPSDTLDAFFGKFNKPFPERVATDKLRRVIRSTSVGYSPAKSLGIDGWTWAGKPPTPAAP